jgi:uncharacterized protein (DUF433 family)
VHRALPRPGVPNMTIIHTDLVPLCVDETGTIRVCNTRITLDVLLGYLLRGVQPEQIVSPEWYPTLSLADVHAVLAYYYRHQAELDEYLSRRHEQADSTQKEIEATRPTFADVKARLLAKRDAAHARPAE